MEINRSGKLFKFAYYGTSRYDIPDQISLCAFFWRTFVFRPIILLFALIATGFFVYSVGILTWISRGLFPLVVGAVATLAYQLTERNTTIRNLVGRSINAVNGSVPYQGLKAVKGRFCPLIKFVGDR